MTNKFFAILALQFFVSIANAIQLPDFPFIYSQGYAAKEIPPNTVELNFYVKIFDENPETAFKLLQKQNIDLVKLFKDLDIPDENIESYDIQKTTVRENKDYQELKVLGYDISQGYTLRLKDINKYTALMNKIVSYRNIVNFNSKFDVAERQDVEASLLIEAYADAKNRAKNIANSVGAQLDAVFAISEKGFGSIEGDFGISNASDKSDYMFNKASFNGNPAVITFVPYSIKIEKRVNVIYKLGINQ